MINKAYMHIRYSNFTMIVYLDTDYIHIDNGPNINSIMATVLHVNKFGLVNTIKFYSPLIDIYGFSINKNNYTYNYNSNAGDYRDNAYDLVISTDDITYILDIDIMVYTIERYNFTSHAIKKVLIKEKYMMF